MPTPPQLPSPFPPLPIAEQWAADWTALCRSAPDLAPSAIPLVPLWEEYQQMRRELRRLRATMANTQQALETMRDTITPEVAW